METKKSIIVFGLSNTFGGVEKYLLDIQKNIANVEFNYLVNDDICSFEDQMIKNGGKVIKIGKNNKLGFIYKITSVLKDFRTKGGCVYINISDPKYENLILLFLSLLLDYKVICHSHGAKSPIINSCLHKFTHAVIIKISHLLFKNRAVNRIAVSERAGKYIYKNLSFNILWAGIKPHEYLFNENLRKSIRKDLNLGDTFVLLFVGRLVEIKNPFFAIKVFNEIHKLEPNSNFLILGNGEFLDSCKQLTLEFGISNNVKFMGFVPNVKDYLSVGDGVIGSSFSEAMPIAFMEAQANGLPCFCIKENYPQEIALSDLMHFISVNSSPEDWAKIILNVMKENKNDRCKYNSVIGNTKTDINVVTKMLTSYIYE